MKTEETPQCPEVKIKGQNQRKNISEGSRNRFNQLKIYRLNLEMISKIMIVHALHQYKHKRLYRS